MRSSIPKDRPQISEIFTNLKLKLREKFWVWNNWVDEIDVLEFDNQPIPLMGRPHWIAPLQRWLQSGMALRLRIDLAHRNEAAIAAALRKVTQRVNLFDKVLIPETLANIRRIRIFLDDKDREAVVTSKIAKGKHAQNEVAV